MSECINGFTEHSVTMRCDPASDVDLSSTSLPSVNGGRLRIRGPLIDFVNKYAGNLIYSQNGEEKLTLEALRRMGIEKGYSVEVGGSNGRFCSNTALLLERGWSGSFIECDFGLWQQCRDTWKQRPDVKCICSRVDEKNINAFVDDSCDLLSVDTDGSDYEIFQGLKARPKIVIVEVDSSIPPESDERNADGAVGYGPMLRLGIEKGYFLLAHTGNLVVVRNDFRHLFPEIIGDGVSNAELYFKRDWLREAA